MAISISTPMVAGKSSRALASRHGRSKTSRIYPSARLCHAQSLAMLRRMQRTVISHDHLARRDRTDTAVFCLRCSPQAPQRKNTLINESDRGEVVSKLEDNAFDDLPLLLAVPRAAALLGISRAATYRLVASGELPVRRLGGRVYVVTAGLRELVAS